MRISLNDKIDTEKKIREYLISQSDISFAYLFGSFVERPVYRDIDVGVFLKPEKGLLRVGALQSDLVSLITYEVDVVQINHLPKKRPAFAYEIVTSGKVLFAREQKIHDHYKTEAFRYYLDTGYLRKIMDKAFQKRLETGNFGKRSL